MRKLFLITGLLIIGIIIAGCGERAYIYPEVEIEILSATGNIWPTREYLLQIKLSGATEASIDRENVEIISGIIQKEITFEGLKKNIFIEAKNAGHSNFEFLSLTREKTEEELKEDVAEKQNEASYNKQFLEGCVKKIKKDTEDVFKVLWDIEVSKVKGYTEDTSKIEWKFTEKYTVNPIRNIFYSNTYLCTKNKKTQKIATQLLDVRSKSEPCPDGSNPPVGMRCK